MSAPELRPVIDPYSATEASNAVIDAAAAQAFRTDDLGGHVRGRWDWGTIPAEGRRNYRALAVAVLGAAILETERQCETGQERQAWTRPEAAGQTEMQLHLDLDEHGRALVHEAVLAQLLHDAGWERTA